LRPLAVSYFLFFFLDEKETKNQEKTILSPRKASPRPAFFRATALCRLIRLKILVPKLQGEVGTPPPSFENIRTFYKAVPKSGPSSNSGAT
jgi:hypothetical protein